MSTPSAFDQALQPIREALEADGYSLDIAMGDGERLLLEIRAEESACEECLVPPPLMRTMIDQTFADCFGAGPEYDLVYPGASSD